MNDSNYFENNIRQQWEYWNSEGIILYRPDTLTTRTLTFEGVELHLIHNACRDVYDRSLKSIDKPARKKTPFADGSNPELASTEDQKFKILGNRFACMQYQSVMVPTETQNILTEDFLEASLQFAVQHPKLTLMYNAINAGKTVHNQYWLLSFHNYKTLGQPQEIYEPLVTLRGLTLRKRNKPCYMIAFDISENISTSTKVLYKLADFMEHKSFNMFLFSNRAYFIPRENVEIPTGFENHRFGGLEMIGYFIMKSIDELKRAAPVKLVDGIREISYTPINQKHLEEYLLRDQ